MLNGRLRGRLVVDGRLHTDDRRSLLERFLIFGSVKKESKLES